MSRFGKTIFGGSRFIFWSTAPVLLLCAAVLPLLVNEWDTARVLFVAAVEALLLLLTLALYDPRRFAWATRCVTGIVFCAYLAYAVDELFLSGKPFEIVAGSRSAATPRNALMGFVVIGLPCLWYTLFGRFSPRGGGGPRGGGTGQRDKLDAADL